MRPINLHGRARLYQATCPIAATKAPRLGTQQGELKTFVCQQPLIAPRPATQYIPAIVDYRQRPHYAYPGKRLN
jgi:hypothetical protein